MMPIGLKDLLRAFNEHGVRYLVVGGYAFGVHAEPRATQDLDLLIRSDEANSAEETRFPTRSGAVIAASVFRNLISTVESMSPYSQRNVAARPPTASVDPSKPGRRWQSFVPILNANEAVHTSF